MEGKNPGRMGEKNSDKKEEEKHKGNVEERLKPIEPMSPEQRRAKSPKQSGPRGPKQAGAKVPEQSEKKGVEQQNSRQRDQMEGHAEKSRKGSSDGSRDGKMSIGFIGAGNMSKAIVKGLLDSYPSDRLFVSAPTDRNLAFFEKLKCRTTHNNNDIVSECQVVFLCVKPSQCDLAIREITDWQGKLIISVLAGIPLERLYRLICKDDSKPVPKLIRCAPNTPMMVSKGVCCISPGPGVPVQDTQLALELLKPCCLVVKTVPESQLDAICALSGSGPAFLYMVIEALSDGAVKMGLPRDLAMELAAAMVEGSARMVSHTGYHPGQLKDAVASPGGTTICGIHVLEKGSLRSLFMDAIEATTQKSLQLRGNQ